MRIPRRLRKKLDRDAYDSLSTLLLSDRGPAFLNLVEKLVGSDKVNFERIFNICQEIDSHLIRFVRAVTLTLTPLETQQQYKVSLHTKLDDLTSDAGGFVTKILESPMSPDSEFLVPQLRVLVDKSLDTITFKTEMGSIRVDDPELMWDCNTQSTSSDEHTSTCPIHSQASAEEVSQHFSKSLVAIHYDGIEVLWQDLDDFWPPSVDSFHLVEKLELSGIKEKRMKTVLDVGSGTGFLGLWIAKQNATVRRVFLSEWLLVPLLYSTINAELNHDREWNSSVVPLLGLNTDWPNKSKIWRHQPVDLLVCNPPYLPIVHPQSDLYLKKAVIGTDLLEHIIMNGLNISKEVIVNFSDLALPEAQAACNRSGVSLEEIGQGNQVPFRVRDVLNDEDHLSFLITRGLIEETSSHGHLYQHVVRTYRVVE